MKPTIWRCEDYGWETLRRPPRHPTRRRCADLVNEALLGCETQQSLVRDDKTVRQ